jgi:DNA polymerase I-like protein with 3'-5' exonuclease and polymerase domains
LIAAAPYSTFYTVIHDELLMEVDDHMLDQFRIDTKIATDSLNEDLNWSVKIRTGFVAGKNLYDAK